MVTIHDDGSLSVKDDGGGISVALHPDYKLPYIELAMTSLRFPGHSLTSPIRVLGGCGVGTKCVNAVSEWMQIDTVWQANEFSISFARGQVTKKLIQLPGPPAGKGTVVRFKPDSQIFKDVTFDRNFLARTLDHLAVLYPNLVFLLIDERNNIACRPLVSLFHYPRGIADYLSRCCPAESRLHPEPVALNGEVNGVKVVLGFQFADSFNTLLPSFTNSSLTSRGGTHVQGLLMGLADAFNELARPRRAFGPADMRSGLYAFVSVFLTDPHYRGATTAELINPEVEKAVREVVLIAAKKWANDSGDHANRVFEWLEKNRGRKTLEPS